MATDDKTTAELAPLTEREQRFVEEMLIDPNRTRAYRIAFPSAGRRRGRANVATLASRLAKKPNVAAELRSARRARAIRSAVKADRVLTEVARVAFSDVLALYGDDLLLLRHPRHVPLDVRRCVRSFKVRRVRTAVTTTRGTTTTVTEELVCVRLHNKVQALAKLCDLLGLNDPIAPLDALLAVLPKKFANRLRREIARESDAPDAPDAPIGEEDDE